MMQDAFLTIVITYGDRHFIKIKCKHFYQDFRSGFYLQHLCHTPLSED